MTFKDFAAAVHDNYLTMSQGELYITDVTDIFEKYLSFYPEGTNPIYRTRTVHDCVCCKQFVRRLGSLVAIVNGKIVTVWDDLDVPSPFKEVADKMSELVSKAHIIGVFRTKEHKYGDAYNYDKKTDERYEHFYGVVSDRHYAVDPEAKAGERNTIFHVFCRGLREIRVEDIDQVLDLIEQNALYRGEEHKQSLLGFRRLLLEGQKTQATFDLFAWANLDHPNARFRNTVIGTLLVDLAEGKDLETAVKAFETKVAPDNYKRPTSIITQKMVEQAIETLNGLGLGGAIYRRHARLSDISVNDVLFVDNDSRSKTKDGVAVLLESAVKPKSIDLKKATAIKADAFVKEVLPTASSLQLFVENRHTGNFVTLTGSDGAERLFKWNNSFAWSYDGDVTDSVKQRVKAAGGNINALLRVSLSWYNTDDLDLHAYLPSGHHVFFANKMGILDVDMNAATLTRNPVENLAFNQLTDGTYKIYVQQYRRRETTDGGFAIEIEFQGQLYQYNYPSVVRDTIECFVLTVQGGRLTDIQTSLKGGNASQEKWGIKTESLVPVEIVLNSPNHWNEQSIGAKHLIFALKGCKNPDPVRGIYNEFLRSDLDKHRKVFEVLGAKSKAQPSAEQISGLGFTSARGDSVTVVVDGGRSYTLEF